MTSAPAARPHVPPHVAALGPAEQAAADALALRLPELRLYNPIALASLGTPWTRFVLKDALNHEAFVDCQLAQLRERLAAERDGHAVVIDGMSPRTELLCARLRELPHVSPSIVAPGYQSESRRLFGVPLNPPHLDRAHLTLRAHVDPAQLAALGPRFCRDYRRRVETHRHALDRALAPFARDDGATVIFVAQKTQYNQLRFSRALRRTGYRTVSVVLDPSTRGHHEGWFDALVTTDLFSLLHWLQRHPHAPPLHTQAWLFRHHLPALIEAFKPPGARQVVELMDLNSFLLPEHELPALAPFMRQVWGEDSQEHQRVQLACERYLCEHADAVIFAGDDGHQRALGLAPSDRLLNFPTYPLEDFFEDRPAVHHGAAPRLVFAAGVVPQGGRHVPELFEDAQWVLTAEHLVSLGLHVDVLNNPGHAEPGAYPYKYPAHLALAKRYPHYRFEVGGPPHQVGKRLAEYDYGLMIYDFGRTRVGEAHFECIVPSKFFLYLEAGLPVLVSARFKAVCRLVRTYGVGVVIDDAAYASLPAVLAVQDARSLRENVRSARRALGLGRQVGRLDALYRRLRQRTSRR